MGYFGLQLRDYGHFLRCPPGEAVSSNLRSGADAETIVCLFQLYLRTENREITGMGRQTKGSQTYTKNILLRAHKYKMFCAFIFVNSYILFQIHKF